jgi:hypothetical protein
MGKAIRDVKASIGKNVDIRSKIGRNRCSVGNRHTLLVSEIIQTGQIDQNRLIIT